jgi:hypothetical protein
MAMGLPVLGESADWLVHDNVGTPRHGFVGIDGS